MIRFCIQKSVLLIASKRLWIIAWRSSLNFLVYRAIGIVLLFPAPAPAKKSFVFGKIISGDCPFLATAEAICMTTAMKAFA
jgi:hypothetical protein